MFQGSIQATDLIHIGLVAMLAGVSASLFNRACFNYPTLGKRYKLATYEAFLNATDSFPDTPDQDIDNAQIALPATQLSI